MGVEASEVNGKFDQGSYFYQYIATVTGCLSIICTGMHFGWPSPSLPQLINPKSTIPVTEDQGSWLASMPCLGAASGSITASIIVDKIGRKKSMLLASPLHFISWIMVAYSPSIQMLCSARFLAGTSDGILFTAFPMYLGEIANSKIRGLLGSSIQVSMTLGMLLINVLGTFFTIRCTALISAIFPALHFVTFFFMPESPYYLVMKNDFNRAEGSLQKLYGYQNVTSQLNEVTESVEEDKETEGKFWELFTLKSNRKAVAIVFGLRGIQQLSGTNAITFYATTIFNESDGEVSSSWSSIIYFAVQLVVATIASLLVDKLGRKPLLTWSIIGSGIALSMEGIYFFMDESTNINMDYLRFLPLVALVCYVIMFNVGMGIIPVLLLGELFPTSVKAVALCFADIFFGVVVTLISKFFQILKDSFGLYVPFFAFTGTCVLGLIFIIYCVPETKGKTLEDIQHYLKATICVLSSEMHFGWTSPALPDLIDGSYKFKITKDEASWLAVMLLAGTILGAIMAGKLTDILGRKKVILITAFPLMMGWLIIALAKNVLLLYIARFIAGVSSGLCFSTVPMYLGEITEPGVRGMLSSLSPVCVVFGILLINILGNYLPIDTTAYISSAFPILLFITFVWMPESPLFLLQKKRVTEAKKTLEILRGPIEAAKELDRLTNILKEESDSKAKIMDLLTDVVNRKAAMVAYGLRTIQQFCGTTAITFYCKSIFEESSTILSPNVSTIIYFTIQLVIAFAAIFVVDILGRKPLMMISLAGSTVSLLALSAYLYLKDHSNLDMSNLQFIPLITLLLNVGFISVGVRNIPLLMLGEMFSSKIKPIGMCFGTIYYSIIAIISAKLFYVTSEYFGMYVPFLIFTILGFFSMFFVVFFVPETKGKSLEDIQNDLRGKRIVISKC